MIVCSAAIEDLQQHEGLLNEYGVDVLPKPFDLDIRCLRRWRPV
jgi:hypothetical protein